MWVNKFEKQVQKQLKEFRLSPSASVWEKVEERIKGKKRRKIFFLFKPVTKLTTCITEYIKQKISHFKLCMHGTRNRFYYVLLSIDLIPH